MSQVPSGKSCGFLAEIPVANLRILVLNPTEEDIQLLLAAQVHIGTKNANTRMTPYIHKRRADGEILLFIS